MSLPRAAKTCADCPWRRDVPVGKFPPERFIALAPTMYDMSTRVFACHRTREGREVACAGGIARTHHNLILRLQGLNEDLVTATGPLYDGYREMAVANGVPADHVALQAVRDPGYEHGRSGGDRCAPDDRLPDVQDPG